MSGNKCKVQSAKCKVKAQNLKFLFFSLSFTLCALCFTLASYADDTVGPNVAGGFYPDDPVELKKMVDGFLQEVNPHPPEGKIFALISPHAGYGYSGRVAAHGYKLIKDKPYKTVIVIGTSHYLGFSGVSVYPQGKFRTPLGSIEIDRKLAQQLLGKDEEIKFDPRAFKEEHSVEVQLPFLQESLSGFKIVPIVMGDCTLTVCRRLASLLKEAIAAREDVLVVASSDLYHGYDYREAQAVDKITVTFLKKMDAEGLYYAIREKKAQACGGFGMVATLLLAKEFGHDKLAVLDQTNSAQVTGNKEKGVWTVGYLSCAIDAPDKEGLNKQKEEENRGEKPMLNKEERSKLLEIARSSIKSYLNNGEKPMLNESSPVLNEEMGVFVTLHEKGALRGCIGNLIGQGPLFLSVRDMAIESATGDPRFPALQPAELKDVEIEISVLSPMKRIKSADEIVLGRHGVLVRKGLHSGVFLPQVADETGWTKEEFLNNLCAHKAGLPESAWKDPSTELYIFTAEIFSEKK